MADGSRADEPYMPSAGSVLVAMGGSEHSLRELPSWEARRLVADGRAKYATVRIMYPPDWPQLAEVVPGPNDVVIQRPAGPIAKPIVNAYLSPEAEIALRKREAAAAQAQG